MGSFRNRKIVLKVAKNVLHFLKRNSPSRIKKEKL